MYRFGVLFFHQNPSTRKNQVCSRCFNDTHCGRLCDIVNMNSSWPHQIAWATHAVTSVWRSLLLFQRVRWKCRLIHRNRVVYFEGFYNAHKPLKVAQSDIAVRLHFRNGSDVFSTPSSSPQTPASLPPRPALTGLGQTCVAGHVVSILLETPIEPIKRHVVTPVVMSFGWFGTS